MEAGTDLEQRERKGLRVGGGHGGLGGEEGMAVTQPDGQPRDLPSDKTLQMWRSVLILS